MFYASAGDGGGGYRYRKTVDEDTRKRIVNRKLSLLRKKKPQEKKAPALAKEMAKPKGNYNNPDRKPSEAQMQIQRMKRWKKPESSGNKSTAKHQGNPNARY